MMITKLNTDGTNSTSVNSQPREPNINTLPSEAQQYYVQLKLLFRNNTQSNLSFRYEVGRVIVRAQTDLDKKANTKSSLRNAFNKLVTRVADDQGINPRTLYNCRRFADWCDQKSFERLSQVPGISWSHVVILLTVPTPKRRWELVNRIGNERWTVEQLKVGKESDKNDADDEPNSRGPGRPLKKPVSLNHAVGQVKNLLGKKTRAMTETLFGDKYDIAKKLIECDENEFRCQRRHEVDHLIDLLRQSIASDKRAIRKLEDAKQRFEEPEHGQPVELIMLPAKPGPKTKAVAIKTNLTPC